MRHKKRIRNRNNKQKKYYSGKKKKHTLKTQVIVDKKSSLIICTDFCNGKKHDFKLFKDSKVHWTQNISGIVDSGYTGIKFGLRFNLIAGIQNWELKNDSRNESNTKTDPFRS